MKQEINIKNIIKYETIGGMGYGEYLLVEQTRRIIEKELLRRGIIAEMEIK